MCYGLRVGVVEAFVPLCNLPFCSCVQFGSRGCSGCPPQCRRLVSRSVDRDVITATLWGEGSVDGAVGIFLLWGWHVVCRVMFNESVFGHLWLSLCVEVDTVRLESGL